MPSHRSDSYGASDPRYTGRTPPLIRAEARRRRSTADKAGLICVVAMIPIVVTAVLIITLNSRYTSGLFLFLAVLAVSYDAWASRSAPSIDHPSRHERITGQLGDADTRPHRTSDEA